MAIELTCASKCPQHSAYCNGASDVDGNLVEFEFLNLVLPQFGLSLRNPAAWEQIERIEDGSTKIKFFREVIATII